MRIAKQSGLLSLSAVTVGIVLALITLSGLAVILYTGWILLFGEKSL